jgi:hypothetical protein
MDINKHFGEEMVYTARDGELVRVGRRQSMPSSSIDNCARLSDTAPSSACGQMKRPRSSRLANRQSPSPSHHSSLMRSPRRPRKTKHVAGVWILLQHSLRDGAQSREAAPQVGDAGANPDVSAGR